MIWLHKHSILRNIFSAAGALPKKYQKDLVKKYFSCYNIKLFGGVAHLGERDIRIVEVTGSSPAVSTIQKALKPCGFGAFFFCGERALNKWRSTVCSTVKSPRSKRSGGF